MPLLAVVGIAHADDAAPPRATRGVVVDAITGAPIAGASVYTDAAEPVVTGPDGGFVVEGPARGLVIVSADHEPIVVDLAPGRPATIALTPLGAGDGDEPGELIELADQAPQVTPGAVRVDREALTVIPGARGDVLTGVKNLPGVANNGSLTPLSSGLIIRGASPETSRILVDGFEIPVLYHFLGVQSVLPTEMLSDLQYLPGAFDASHGRATGGIVAVASRDERPTRAGGAAELSFVNLAAAVETPLGARAGAAVAARRSTIDAVLAGVLPDDSGLSFTALPRYYDYQAKLWVEPSSRWRLAGFVFGSDDVVELVSDGDNAMDPAASGNFANATSFTRGIASARYQRPGLGVALAASAYTDTNHVTVGRDRFLRLDRDGVAGRGELTWDPWARLRVVAGAEADLTRTGYDIQFVRPPREGDPRGPNFTRDALIVATGTNRFRDLGAWASTVYHPIRTVELAAGGRVDAYLRNDAVVVQPRGHAIWRPADGASVRAAAGLYTRPPEHLDQGLQPELGPERVAQTSLGAERRLGQGLRVQATVFYNRMRDLLVLPADRRDEASLAGYVNQGEGDARGVELLLEARTEALLGWLAYTGARSVRRAGPGAPERRFDYDQAHNLIAVASYQLSPRWRIGGRFQLTTGKPYTPVTGAIYQADVDLYLPSYGTPASRRVDVQHQLDLRIDRTWRFAGWTLSGYLDVSNVYLNAAELDYQYSFDYTRRTAITTLPIIPSFGLRGEL